MVHAQLAQPVAGWLNQLNQIPLSHSHRLHANAQTRHNTPAEKTAGVIAPRRAPYTLWRSLSRGGCAEPPAIEELPCEKPLLLKQSAHPLPEARSAWAIYTISTPRNCWPSPIRS